MEPLVFYIDKMSGTSADTLLAVGFAAFIGDLYEQQYGTTEELLIRDIGPYYTVTLPRPLDLDQVHLGDICLPLESGKQREKQARKGRATLDGFDYDGEMLKRGSYYEQARKLGPALQTPEARLRHDPELEALEDFLPDHRLSHYLAISQMNATNSFNELILRWREMTSAQRYTYLQILLDLFGHPNNDVEATVVQVQQFTKREHLQGDLKPTILQIINPVSGKGANRARAGQLSIGGQEGFWLLELLKFRGFLEAAAPLVVKEGNERAKENRDRKTYVLLPRTIELDFLRAMMREFCAVFWPTTYVKLDILASLRFAQVIVAHTKRSLQGNTSTSPLAHLRRKRITSLAYGFEATSYKFLGNAYATMHNARLGLPTWLADLTTLQEVEQAEALLKEHVQLVQSLRNGKGEEGAEEYELLRMYRDFLSAHDLKPFWQFTTTYSTYYMSAREHNRYAVQLNTSGLEQLIMHTPQETMPLAPILKIDGFHHIADAIREATVRGQYRRSQQQDRTYEIRYGLGQELIRQARHRDTFVQALSTFLHDYNAETAREEEKIANRLKRQLTSDDRREHKLRRMVSTADIQEVIGLIDSYGVELIGSLLVAFGHAFDSERVAAIRGGKTRSDESTPLPEYADTQLPEVL